ncbi:amidase [Laetiporus sulphureus 93-53]|uniref:amidase n=1 Tax=Laetiporus sulphureus 93-53 TaxID=1314785 RepID=A0A165FA80_9APHY|nr:amidase [Laetiporus sulphureus 93-53]KZT08664.1 amidase [Laetiporus sulphureus 93-53]
MSPNGDFCVFRPGPKRIMNGTSSDWRDIARRKTADRQARLRQWPHWQLKEAVPNSITDVSNVPTSQLTAREHEIVHQDATSLVERLRDRRYTAVEVLEAFCHVATIAQDLTNCLTEIMFEEGLARARELDQYLRRTGQVVGPLHGLPVSIKDHIRVKGCDGATGYVTWAYHKVAPQDAVAVDILRKAGAIIYVKTANPQTLLSLETNNNIYGRTSNPFNRALTPGGSSGGESALIALHGSPMGIGTDIGGSIRIPAAHMGLYGLKGSVGRLPHAGLEGSHDGMDAIVGALGPLATSARDLALFCRVMLEYEPWLIEPPLLEIPWKQSLTEGKGLPEKLSIAILWDDGVVAPHPPILDALKRTKDTLIAAGHDVISWIPIDHKEAWDLMLKLYFLDGGEEYRETMKHEPMVPQTEWIMSQVPNEGKPYAAEEIFRLNVSREAFRTRIAAHWNDTRWRTATGRPVDAVLSPVAPTLAPPHDTTRWWGYTSYWNLLDFPAAVFPIGRFRAGSYVPLDVTDEFVASPNARSAEEQYVRRQWVSQTYDNASVSLQLIGRRLNEERLLGVLSVVEGAMRKSQGNGA